MSIRSLKSTTHRRSGQAQVAHCRRFRARRGSGGILQRLRRAVQCLSGLADAQLEPRQRYGDFGIGGDGLHAFQQYSFGCGGAAEFRFEFGKCDVRLGAFGICIEDVLEVAAGFIRSACRKSQLRERIVRAYIAMPDFAGRQQRLPPLPQLALVQLDGGGQDLANRLGGGLAFFSRSAVASARA